jgi:hypothetical protein
MSKDEIPANVQMALKASHLSAAVMLGVCSVLALLSLSDASTFFVAMYIFFFGVVICSFELKLKVSRFGERKTTGGLTWRACVRARELIRSCLETAASSSTFLGGSRSFSCTPAFPPLPAANNDSDKEPFTSFVF